MNEISTNELYAEPPVGQPPNGRFRRLLWGSTLIALLFLILAGLTLWLDPFGWSVLDRLSGRYDATATAVPPNSLVYVGVNLLNGNIEDMKALRDTFATPLADADVNLDDAQQEFTDMLATDYGLTFADDVQPWLGQYLGFALLDVTLGEFDSTPDASWLLLAETRNGSAADAFLTKVAAAWAENNDATPVSESYNGVTITAFVAERPGAGLALAQSGRMMLAAANSDVLKQAIDAQKGESLADKAEYQTAVADLPDARMVTMYMDGAQLTDMVQEMNASMSGLLMTSATSALPTDGLRGTAVSLTFIDAGLQIDSINTYDPDALPAAQRALLSNAYATAPVSLSLYPENTFFYVGVQGLGAIWETYRDLLVAQMGDPEAYAEAMALFARDFGVNPDTDFFPYLGQEIAVGLMPGDSGVFAEEMDLPLEALMLLGTNNETALAASLEAFTAKVSDPDSGLGEVNRLDSNGLILYEFATPFSESAQFMYGLGRGYFYLGTSVAGAQALQFGGGPSLADNAGYRTAVAALPTDMVPTMYLDLRSMISVIRSSAAASGMDMAGFDQTAAVLYPLHTIAAAARVSETAAQQMMILFIER